MLIRRDIYISDGGALEGAVVVSTVVRVGAVTYCCSSRCSYVRYNRDDMLL